MDAHLRGADLPELGEVASAAVAPDLAIALTRGRHRKAYAYTDPNEDVVAVRRAGDRALLVVADGHSGHHASHVAVDAVLQAAGDELPAWSHRDAVHVVHAVNERVREVRRPLEGDHRRTRTTLALAVVAHDADGQRFIVHAAVGDSAVLVVREGAVHLLTADRHRFLGDAYSRPMVAGVLDHGETDLREDDAVVLVTDGFTGFAPLEAVASALAGAATAQEAAIALVDAAGDAGAGDNVAAAVLLPAAAAAGGRA